MYRAVPSIVVAASIAVLAGCGSVAASASAIPASSAAAEPSAAAGTDESGTLTDESGTLTDEQANWILSQEWSRTWGLNVTTSSGTNRNVCDVAWDILELGAMNSGKGVTLSQVNIDAMTSVTGSFRTNVGMAVGDDSELVDEMMACGDSFVGRTI